MLTAVRALVRRLRDLSRRGALERDLQEQIDSHVDEATENYVRMGLSPDDARRAALRRFGDRGRVLEAWREARSFASVDNLIRDVRHAVRSLRRSPGFAMIVLIVLTIGTAALTTVFTLLNRVVLRPLPFPESDRLVVLRHSAPGMGLGDVGLSHGLYWQYAEHVPSIESLAVYKERSVLNLRVPDRGTQQVVVTYASAELFNVLRARPALGRLFTQEDGRPGFMNLKWRIPVLLSHALWASHFGADPTVIGRTLTVNDNPREVIGVLPEGFDFPRADTQMWMLLEPPKAATSLVGSFPWDTVARMRPGATAGSLRTELTRVVQRLALTDEDAARAELAPVVASLKSTVIRNAAPMIWLLFGGMTVLLLVTCANAGGLFLIRADDRAHEIAVRRSLGACTPHLARLFFVEALALTAIAAAAGLLCVNLILSAMPALIPFELPRAAEVEVDGVTIALVLALALFLAVIFGTASLRRARQSPDARLTAGGGWSTGRRSTVAGADVLIVCQVALALTLMVGAALMARTYQNLSHRDLGFSAGNVLTIEIGLPWRKASRHVRIYQSVVDELDRLPRIDSASAASFVPLTPTEHAYPVEPGGTPVPFKFFLPGYFQTMGTQIVEGNAFAPHEQVPLPHPVLVSAALARRLYPDGSAVGKVVHRLDEDGRPVDVGGAAVPPFTVAGIVADVQETDLRLGPAEVVYIPLRDPPVELSIVPTTMRVAVRSNAPLSSLAADIRAAISRVDPDLSVGRIETMHSIVGAARAKEGFVGTLLLIAAGVSVLLGAVGVYGSVAQVIRRRTREIGIRLALGATPAEVIRMVTAGSARAVAAGGLGGVLLSYFAVRTLRSLLFGVDAHDPAVLVLVSTIVFASAASAALLAARRGARIAPVIALRSE